MDAEDIVKDDAENVNSNIGKIRKRTDKLCPDCEDGILYIVSYETDRDGILYSQEFLECMECGYKVERKNKHHYYTNSRHKENDLTSDSY